VPERARSVRSSGKPHAPAVTHEPIDVPAHLGGIACTATWQSQPSKPGLWQAKTVHEVLGGLTDVPPGGELPQVGCPLGDQALGLASGTGVFGFGITSPTSGNPMIMADSRDLPA
jgi:hypothetical protein